MRSRNPIWLGALLLCVPLAGLGAEVESDVAERVDDLSRLAIEAEPLSDFIYKIEGQGAVFLINTSEGSVLVDTGFDNQTSVKQKALIDQIATGPVKKIIVTHSHQDHAGGLLLWREALASGTEFIAHQRYGHMSRQQLEPLAFFKKRYKRIYPIVDLDPTKDRSYWEMRPARKVYVGQDYAFELGGVHFRVIALDGSGEGEDSVLVWLPDQQVLFAGDLFGALYPMFPNLYTVRGEAYRDPLDYISALDLVLELDPKIMAPTHFKVLSDPAYIRQSVTKQRDAVQFMWDRTIAGMNAGKTVWQLMDEVKLPPELALSQGHGKVSWSVRGTWEKLSGWYLDDTVANLYHVPPEAVYGDVIELLGGPDALADRARKYLDMGRPLEALRLLDIAAANANEKVLRTRIDALSRLLGDAQAGLNNYSEVEYLRADIRNAEAKLPK
jgi:alkyl sulfatase BDS1-like metallo-beta-lactamase superfamily hydrolase